MEVEDPNIRLAKLESVCLTDAALFGGMEKGQGKKLKSCAKKAPGTGDREEWKVEREMRKYQAAYKCPLCGATLCTGEAREVPYDELPETPRGRCEKSAVCGEPVPASGAHAHSAQVQGWERRACAVCRLHRSRMKVQGFLVYRVWYGDTLVYVGRTKQPLQDRIRGHLFQKPMHRTIAIEQVTKIEYAEFQTEADMNLYEIYFILKWHPRLNVDDKTRDFPTVDLPPVEWREFSTKLWDQVGGRAPEESY